MSKSRYRIAKNFLIFWTLFIGVGAIGGALGMLIDPTGKAIGMDAMLPFFQKLPFADILFKDFTFSGYALLIVNGVSNITATMLLLLDKKSGVILGSVFGVTLMLWICIQFYMFPPNLMSTAFFIFGLCQTVTGYCAFVFKKQEKFSVDEADYPNIAASDKKAVVYFSRMGYVKKIAFEEANKTGAVIFEIKATEKTQGTLGFWWCGRFGMHRWDMPIENSDTDFSAFDEVTVCSPIWVFSLASPVRAFLKQATGKIKKVNYIFVHHTNSDYKNAVDTADEILGIKHSGYKNIRCRKGKFKILKTKG